MIIKDSVITNLSSESSGINVNQFYLSDHNMSKYGFARFYYPGEEQLVNNVWMRDIEIASYGADKFDHLQFALPGDKLIPLSTENKITLWKNFYINSGKESAAPINILSQRAGWNQTDEDITKIVRLNHEASFVASIKEDNNDIALGGGIVLKVSKKLNWIGMILVHPELRRQGIAKEIMKRCIEVARIDKGMPIIGLDATPMGMPLYSLLSFKESFRIWRSTVDTDVSVKSFGRALIEPIGFIDKVTGYLQAKLLSDKLELFGHLISLHKDGCFVAKLEDKICGVLMSRRGRLKSYIGFLIVDSYFVPQSLLSYALKHWRDQGFESVFLDIPEYHFEKRSKRKSTNKCYSLPEYCGLHSSIKPVREFVRMYQLISNGEVKNIIKVESNGVSKTKKKNRYEMAMQLASKCYGESLLYMEKEKNRVLPYLFSIGGPEIS